MEDQNGNLGVESQLQSAKEMKGRKEETYEDIDKAVVPVREAPEEIEAGEIEGRAPHPEGIRSTKRIPLKRSYHTKGQPSSLPIHGMIANQRKLTIPRALERIEDQRRLLLRAGLLLVARLEELPVADIQHVEGIER